MHTFDSVGPQIPGGDRGGRTVEDRAAGRGRAIPRRRHDANRSDEAERRNTRVVVDINRLPLNKIEVMSEGGIKIGATVRNSELAYHQTVQRDYAVLSQALLRRLGPDLKHGDNGW